ncbi:hypothetical protein CAEBREN_16180 [Caenorhabditis brenneri]|uniref:Uncharacterized protein n=1 Tax=Caenorhabditis brenneri TaxID=135651 RepID=G0MMH7_CAEBE|nr:hypothetical protein CAEBREN_16180 [Caenorhabditis brenneri]
MSTTLVSLESLQYLLQYMDANRRFEIYNRCPSLRDLEKSVPLKIESLVFEERCIVVNDTSYKLGIIQKYIVGETPKYVAERNENGGVFYEMDRYGIMDQLDAWTVTPGDIGIELGGEPWIENEDAYIGTLQHNIQQYELEIAQQLERMPHRNQEARRRDNQPSNYEHFVQITTSKIVHEQEQKTIQRYIHNKKFSEAMKQLAIVLFGGRSSPIYVTEFNFDCEIGVTRLPVGVKFHIEQLMFPGDVATTLDALAPIIQDSSYPLKELCISYLSGDDVNNPIVKAAGVFEIREPLTNVLQTLSTITNPVVHVATSLTNESLEELIAHWIESNRPVGNEYTIHHVSRHYPFHEVDQSNEGHILANLMEDTLKKLKGVPIDEENMIIPMSDETRLKVSYGPFPEFAPYSKWAVKFLTELIEH